jgi:hypothetical protein
MGHHEGPGEERRYAHQGGDRINSKFQSLTSSPTWSPGSPQFQVDVEDAYEIRFGHFTYAQKEDEITFTVAPV